MQGMEQAKKQAAEEIWLSYFNEQAYAAGLIDEKTRNRIRVALVRAKAKSGTQQASKCGRYSHSSLEQPACRRA